MESQTISMARRQDAPEPHQPAITDLLGRLSEAISSIDDTMNGGAVNATARPSLGTSPDIEGVLELVSTILLQEIAHVEAINKRMDQMFRRLAVR